MIKKTFIEVKVPCKYYSEGTTIKHCEDCNFFNGYEKNENDEIIGVDCLRGEIGSLSAHVTEFTSKGYLYKSRYYDSKIDGNLSKAYDYCEKCCFNKTLKNGNEVCLLRISVPSDEVESFCCYEGEIWTKEEIKDEEE